MIHVLKPGLLTTVQDDGRKDYLAFGLPRAGVMDRYAAGMANLLCGNPLRAAVLEMTITGGIFQFTQSCRISVCGAKMPVLLNDKPVDNWTAIDIVPNDIVEVGTIVNGCRSYLAVNGGVAVPVIMGSRSTYFRASIGGFEGRSLKTGDNLAIGESLPLQKAPARLPMELIPHYCRETSVRVILGPQKDLFSNQGIETFLASTYVVTNDADRMGYRTEGPLIEHKGKADIVSDALVPGSIQIPGNGQPIIMMVDCGTTGGYAKIATVIGADLWKIGQTKPQDRLRFVECKENEAIQALVEEQERYRIVAELVVTGVHEQSAKARQNKTKKFRVRILGRSYEVVCEEVN